MAIRIKPSHKGLLHKKLGVPEGERIPQSKIKAAEHSSSPALRKEANFADTAEHKFHHRGTSVKYGEKSSFQKRGHFETHRQESDRSDLSHNEFESLDHGKNDHMPHRKTQDFERGHVRVGFLLAILAAAIPALALGAAATGPVGVFGGAGLFANLPGNIPLTFSSAPTSTSGTLATAWTPSATSELVVFSDGEVRTVTFTQNSTSVSWSGALLGTPTVNATVDGFTTPPGAGTEGFTSDFGNVTSTGTYWTWSGFQDATPVAPIAATITGCGTVTAVAGGATAGTFTAGQTGCVPVFHLPYSANGWYCSAWDITTNTDTLKQSADTTTSCTMTGTVVNADVIVWQARGF